MTASQPRDDHDHDQARPVEVWRVGRKLGRTLYLDDHVIGMVDTPELAARIVFALIEVPKLRASLSAAWSVRQGVEKELRLMRQRAERADDRAIKAEAELRQGRDAGRCQIQAEIEGHSEQLERCQLVTEHGGPHYHEGAIWGARSEASTTYYEGSCQRCYWGNIERPCTCATSCVSVVCASAADPVGPSSGSGSIHGPLSAALIEHQPVAAGADLDAAECSCGGPLNAAHYSDVLLPILSEARAKADSLLAPFDVVTQVIGRVQANSVLGALKSHGLVVVPAEEA